jgi:hypothetical protein
MRITQVVEGGGVIGMKVSDKKRFLFILWQLALRPAKKQLF